MEQQEKIRLLISIQEYPERYTDEQLQQLMADDPELAELLEQLALTKQALVKREVNEETVNVEEEWQKFAANASRFGLRPSFHQVAASIIGILFTAGVAFAAIHIVSRVSDSKPQAVQAEQTIPAKPASALPTDTIKPDTTTNTKPIVFDNVALEKMLPQIAASYNKEVEFLNADARQLRFYFVWKQNETLDVVLHRLNLFESITVELKSDRIVVE